MYIAGKQLIEKTRIFVLVLISPKNFKLNKYEF